MSSKFEPLLPSLPSTAGPRRELDSAAVTAAFVALASSPTPAAAAAACAHTPAQSPAKPTLTLQRDGDRVTHVRVECTCGQVFELECA